MRTARVLTPLEVRQKSEAIGEHNVGGVAGTLLLVVRKTQAGEISRAWKFVIRAGGTKQTFGLGRYTYKQQVGAVTLAEAREKAQKIREDILEGRDPRAGVSQEVKSDKPAEHTLDELFPKYFAYCEKMNLWKSPKMLPDYERLYRLHISPGLGGKGVNEVTPAAIAQVLTTPLLIRSPSTGKKAQHLLSPFFRWCLRLENSYRSPALGNPATSEVLKDRLPKAGQCKATTHHPMCHLEDLPRFVQLLVESGRVNDVGGMACLFILLTASRQGNVIKNSRAGAKCHAVWADIDKRRALWTIPAQKMKVAANGAHVVPLSKQALAILSRLEALGMSSDEDALFRSLRGKVVGEAACARIIKNLSVRDREAGGNGFVDKEQGGRLMTMHGTARAAFQTWAAEQGYSRDLTEAALHHTKGGNGDAYLRTKYAEQRRQMMQVWADFLFSECPKDWAKFRAK